MPSLSRHPLVDLSLVAVIVLLIVCDQLRRTDLAAPRLMSSETEQPLEPETQPTEPVPTIIDDQHVQRAAHQGLLPLVATQVVGQVPTPRLISISESREDHPRTWNIEKRDQTIRLRSRSISLTFDRALDIAEGIALRTPEGRFVTTDGNVVANSPDVEVSLKTTENQLTLTLPAEVTGPIAVLLVNGTSTRELATFRPFLPDANTRPPILEGALDNELADTPRRDPAQEVLVFGTYLRIDGKFEQVGYDPNASEIEVEVFKEDRGVELILQPTVDVEPVQGLDWFGNIRLADRPRGDEYELAIWHRKGNFVAPASINIKIKVADREPFAVPPVVASATAVEVDGAFVIKNRTFSLNVTTQVTETRHRERTRLLLYRTIGGRRSVVGATGTPHAAAESTPIALNPTAAEMPDGLYEFDAEIVQGNLHSKPSKPFRVRLVTSRPKIESIDPPNLLFGPGRIRMKLYFSPENPLKLNPTASTELKSYFRLLKEGAVVAIAPVLVEFDRQANSVDLTFADIEAEGELQLEIGRRSAADPSPTSQLADVYGLELDEASRLVTFIRSRLAETPTVAPGLSHTTGPYVAFPEFTPPRNVPDGFNPSDKVETRVARLYYFRDAHRVAQIVNRKVKSYNRQGVDMARQLADKSRNLAEEQSLQRQSAERAAIAKAEQTRRLENQLSQAEAAFNRTLEEISVARTRVPPPEDAVLRQLEAAAGSFRNQVNDLRGRVELQRDEEVRANDLVQRLEGEERLAREEQFRREVAAAHADPDTYVDAKVNSDDPVEQVSVSVIGEGLIQLRGPLKGVNIIRIMIDQLDSPVGQVRVGVHTVQINGEKERRMEQVADRVQKYIDHSRFLTLQSGEILRKAVVQVAARKAEECRGMFPGDDQESRDRRYLDAFFGQDFIAELRSIDSEFLRTGNKVLSLHSMDVTSLASALNLMALANNGTRREILEEFDGMVQSELPRAELSNLEAGFACTKSRLFDHHRNKHCLLGQNARFESLRGFFNSEIADDHTMTPMQREFVRLAQIFKSRLVTELEYKQRVMERAIIEERLGDRLQELREARAKEATANGEFDKSREKFQQARSAVAVTARLIQSRIELAEQGAAAVRTNASKSLEFEEVVKKAFQQTEQDIRKLRPDARERVQRSLAQSRGLLTVPLRPDEELTDRVFKITDDLIKAINPTPKFKIDDKIDSGDLEWQGIPFSLHAVRGGEFRIEPPQSESKIREQFEAMWYAATQAEKELGKYRHSEPFLGYMNEASEQLLSIAHNPNDLAENIVRLKTAFNRLDRVAAHVVETSLGVRDAIAEVVQLLATDSERVAELGKRWNGIEQKLQPFLGEELQQEALQLFGEARVAIRELLGSFMDYTQARDTAERSRRPLDHKKFLDMLIDDLEEKYIELLEGTRAHTANIDNYLKRLTTALDDDFNTQFYYPAFRLVREASTFHDVQFGQTETTNVLANNREFAKVSPRASMEFDLPARDIMVTEAISGAKAVINDVGALANDPTFLSLARLQSGQSPSNLAAGGGGGFGVVRDVIPGLNAQTSEDILSQNANGTAQFGSNLENLIPDPAVYKFETGTGYEIRPVIQPDGQAVVFGFNYLYTTNIREPIRADEKHLGRVKQHYINTDVQLSNYELREVGRYTVALKAARTSRGVPLLEDIPVAGVLFRPLPSDESSLQQNLVLAQATIFPTLFDLMGLRWAPAVADLDPLRLSNEEFIARGRRRALQNRVYDYSSEQVDEFLRIPSGNRRPDLYRTQESVPYEHPNGYRGPGLDLRDSQMQEGYRPAQVTPPSQFVPSQSKEGKRRGPGRHAEMPGSDAEIEIMPAQPGMPQSEYELPEEGQFSDPVPESIEEAASAPVPDTLFEDERVEPKLDSAPAVPVAPMGRRPSSKTSGAPRTTSHRPKPTRQPARFQSQVGSSRSVVVNPLDPRKSPPRSSDDRASQTRAPKSGGEVQPSAFRPAPSAPGRGGGNGRAATGRVATRSLRSN